MRRPPQTKPPPCGWSPPCEAPKADMAASCDLSMDQSPPGPTPGHWRSAQHDDARAVLRRAARQAHGQQRSAPRVVGAQSRRYRFEDCLLEDRALAPDAFFGDV